MKYGVALVLITLLCLMAGTGAEGSDDRYRFDGTISRDVLENYLARAITMMDLATGRGSPDDNVRMLRTIGAKFAGRTIYLWGDEPSLEWRLEKAREIIPKVHKADPDMILQAGIFEIVTTKVGEVPIPARV